MPDNYLIVHKSILPEKYESVLKARRLLETGQVRDVSQAAKSAGISRSTYYKYRDYIFEPSERSGSRTAVLEMLLTHTAGQLSAVLSVLSEAGAVHDTRSHPGRAERAAAGDFRGRGERADHHAEPAYPRKGVGHPFH